MWNLKNGVNIHTLKGHSRQVYAVSITPDGKYAISTSDDKTLKVWDLERGENIAVFTGDNSLLTCNILSSGEVITVDALSKMHFLSLEIVG